MPKPGRAWWHLIWSTYGSWLPGDPRGFRNRDHRIHSSGDYKNPPPEGEHAGLHEYAKRVSNNAVVIRDSSIRQRLCRSVVGLLSEMEFAVLIVAVCRTHVHLLGELPVAKEAFDEMLKKLKIKSSASIRDVMPGRIWARGDKRIMKSDPRAQRACFRYIQEDQEQGAVIWTFRDRHHP